MRGSKAGLADLKKLHEKAQAAHKEAQARALAARACESNSESPAERQLTQALTLDARKLFARATQTVQPIQAKGRVLHRRAENHGSHATIAGTPASDAAQLLAQKRMRATGQSDDRHTSIASKRQAGISDIYAPIQDTETEVAWSSTGIGPDTLRKLKQAFWPVGAQLDLHGMTSDLARAALIDFIDSSQQHGTRCIRIVHGQGYGSINGQAVLRNLVIQWLTQMPAIACFATAPQSHGGRGALLALIRQA
jgi:DNA-nicking Smr family endonuclease